MRPMPWTVTRLLQPPLNDTPTHLGQGTRVNITIDRYQYCGSDLLTLVIAVHHWLVLMLLVRHVLDCIRFHLSKSGETTIETINIKGKNLWSL